MTLCKIQIAFCSLTDGVNSLVLLPSTEPLSGSLLSSGCALLPCTSPCSDICVLYLYVYMCVCVCVCVCVCSRVCVCYVRFIRQSRHSQQFSIISLFFHHTRAPGSLFIVYTKYCLGKLWNNPKQKREKYLQKSWHLHQALPGCPFKHSSISNVSALSLLRVAPSNDKERLERQKVQC